MSLLSRLQEWARPWFGRPGEETQVKTKAGEGEASQPEKLPTEIRAKADLVEVGTLQALLKELAGEFAYMMLANTEARRFERFDLAEAEAVTTWPEGRVFGLESELRWRQKRDGCAVCYVTESHSVPDVVASLSETETLKAEPETQALRLWGEHTADDFDENGRPFWLEAQIPRLLTYPTGEATPPVVALRTARYKRSDGTVAFVRFVGLEAWSYG